MLYTLNDETDQQLAKGMCRLEAGTNGSADTHDGKGMGQVRLSLAAETADVRDLYLDLLKKALTRYGFSSDYRAVEPPLGSLKSAAYAPVRRWLAARGFELVRITPFDAERRAQGLDWPYEAETMIGLVRLDHLQACVADVLRKGVPGDLMEAGVWKGGVLIFMRAVLKTYGDHERTVWGADSFEGYPKPDAQRYPADRGLGFWTASRAAVPLEEVQRNIARYGYLDDRVRFIKGWFRQTLPTAPIEQLAVLRLDGVMYESIWDSLQYLYPKVSVGGYVIVDDYAADNPQCVKAVDDYRAAHGISEELIRVNAGCVVWQRCH
jgi:O-methyltransferase